MIPVGIPLWIKIAYTLWMAVWVPVYWIHAGPLNFLWFCDVANFVILAALWLESPLLVSSQAVGTLLIQTVWIVDVSGRLLTGAHLVGGTEYMFDSATPLELRLFSLFHVFTPPLLLWLVRRQGYDRRGWRLQTLILWGLLPLAWLAGPERNLNWVWGPFGTTEPPVPPVLYLFFCMVVYPVVLLAPTHLALRWWARRG